MSTQVEIVNNDQLNMKNRASRDALMLKDTLQRLLQGNIMVIVIYANASASNKFTTIDFFHQRKKF